MPKGRFRMSSSLAVIAVTSAGAGLFATAAPAEAAPGNCEQWVFSSPNTIKLSTGPVLTFSADGPSVQGGAATDSRADTGQVHGLIQDNGQIGLNYRSDTFPDDPLVIFEGNVGEDGRARGNFTAKQNGTWETPSPLMCAAGPSGNSREVTGDVDAFDAPGGTGNVIGMLQGGQGQRVNLAGGCRDDNWCNVAFPAGPGGTAWVWGDFLK